MTVVLAEDDAVDISVVVAALVIWRVCLLLVPLVAGALLLLLWRRRGGVRGPGSAVGPAWASHRRWLLPGGR